MGTYSLGSRLREVVGGKEVSGNAGVETSVPVVCGVRDGVLETAGVLETQVELATLGLVCLSGSGANVCLECIKTKGDDLIIIRIVGLRVFEQVLTVLSGDKVVETDPCGHPLPEEEAESMVI